MRQYSSVLCPSNAVCLYSHRHIALTQPHSNIHPGVCTEDDGWIQQANGLLSPMIAPISSICRFFIPTCGMCKSSAVPNFKCKLSTLNYSTLIFRLAARPQTPRSCAAQRTTPHRTAPHRTVDTGNCAISVVTGVTVCSRYRSTN